MDLIIHTKRRCLLLAFTKQTLKIMRLTVILLLVACMQVSAKDGSGQITLSEHNTPFSVVVKKIQVQSGFDIVSTYETMKEAGNVTVHVKNVSLKDALDACLRQKPLTYLIINKTVVIKSLEVKSNNFKMGDDLQGWISKTKMNGLGSSLGINPEIPKLTPPPVEIKGRVTDENGNPLAGVSVTLKGSSIVGTTTDVNGNYSLSLENGNGVLLFSSIGFEPMEVAIEGKSIINLKMKSSVSSLEDVVIVGYAKQKKVDLTGSVEVVEGKELQNRPVNNVAQALLGTVSGVTISYGNAGFEPGAAPSIQIRGQGSPYVLIDGVAGDISSLDPNMIESISVLKDAAASAIYGARAPYGVLLITTKSGKKNQTPTIGLSLIGGPTTIIRKPRMVDSYTFVKAMNEMHDNQGVARLFIEPVIDRIIDRISDPNLPETVPDPNNPTRWSTYTISNGNNDWVNVHYGRGYRMQENLSLTGGGNNVTYYISGGHAEEKGPLKMVDDHFGRNNLDAKINVSLTKWWQINSNSRIISGKRDRPIYNGEGDYGMLIHQIYRTQPEVFLKSPNGYYSQLSRIPQMRAGYENFLDKELVQTISTSMQPINNWFLNADYSFDYSQNDYDGLNLVAYEDQVDGSLVPISLTVPSYITKDRSSNTYNSLNLYSTYSFNLKADNHFKILVGYQQESNKYDYLRGLKRNLINPDVPSITTATGDMQSLDDLSHWATMGYFGRINYDFKEKYLFEFNMRRDGTSKFAIGRRWGTFPSFSLGWNISKEKFWEPILPFFPSLKLRTSWGILGNQNVSPYQDIALLIVNSNLPWLINGQRPAYVSAPNLVNESLTWESSRTLDFGIDLSMFNNRIELSFDYYHRVTFNRLGPAQALPSVIGANIPKENNSELSTRGWDFLINWQSQVNKDISYSASLNVFNHINIVSKFPNPTGILTTDYNGKHIGEIWGYETVGLIKDQRRADDINSSKSQSFINGQPWRTGDVEYMDLNNDGVINNGKNTINDHGDLKIIGNSTPRYQFGLNLSLKYKDFDIGVFLQGTAKRDLWLTGNIFWGFNQWNQTSLFENSKQLDYYRDAEATTYSGLGTNTDSYFPRPYSAAGQYSKNQQVQTRYLQNGAFVRLKNLQVGYNLSESFLKTIRIKRLRIFFSGENIYTLTKLPVGFDPETATVGEFGNGKGMLSQAAWSFGLSTTF